jgi:hypothetical protein
MNRLAGIICAAVGLIIALLSIFKVMPNLTSTGIALLLLGGLVTGLSFVSGPEQDETPRMSTAATLLNIFVSPTEVFQNLRRHPRWLVAVIITTLLSTVFSLLFLQRLTPERVVNFAIDKTLEVSWVVNNPEMRKGIEESRAGTLADAKNPVKQAGQAINSFVRATFFVAFLALIYFLFALAMGGKINYWQAFAVAAYAAFPIAVIRYVLGTIILYLKDPTDIHPVLGQAGMVQDNLNFLINPAQSPVLYVLLGGFSLLAFYWIFLNVTGLKNAGEKMTPAAAWAGTLVVWIGGILLLAGWVAAFPGFLS